jgi:hypothetical protein
MELAIIASAGIAGWAGIGWPAAALAGATVFVLIELASRSSPDAEPLSQWQIGLWRSIAGANFIGAGECCLGRSIGTGLRLLVG